MASDPLIGRVLHDTHEVLRLIGKGGMGSVYEARHVHLNKSFAVKVLDPRFAENETVFARFKREALISSSLGHPAIVQVSDFYLHDDGRPCMVMEYLEGKDLGVVLKERKVLPPEEMVQIIEQVAGALQAVHEREIVHRDMKPGNIFLVDVPDGQVQAKVLDFGISKFKNPDDGMETLTTTQTILGTPHFMSPEQALGEVGDVDWRTDIFALATICYYAMSGKLPFNAPSLHGVLVKIQTMEPAPIMGLLPEVSGKVHLVLQKAMAKDKANRYERVEEFAAELREALMVRAGEDGAPKGALEMATMMDMQPVFAVEGEQESAEADPPSPVPEPEKSEGPAAPEVVDPNMTNVLPLDELMGEVGGSTSDEPLAAELDAAESEPPVAVELEQDSHPAVSPHTTLSGAAGEQSTQKLALAPGRKPAAAKAIAVAAVLVLALGGVYMATTWSPADPGSRGDSVKPSQAAASIPEPAPQPVKLPPPAKPIPAQVKVAEPESNPSPARPEKTVAITLQITPRNANVFLDGRLRSENPLHLPFSTKQRQLRVEAKGYRTREQGLRANADLTIKVDLSRAAPVVARKPRRARGPSTAVKPRDRVDPFAKKPRPATKKKSTEDDGFSTLTAPKPRPKKKSKEEAFDSL